MYRLMGFKRSDTSIRNFTLGCVKYKHQTGGSGNLEIDVFWQVSLYIQYIIGELYRI